MSYFDDMEDILDKKEGRDYKRRAGAAMDKRTLKSTSRFKETYKRWRQDRKRLGLLKSGLADPKSTLEVDWGKIAFTTSIQLASITVALLCIIIGIWPVVFLTVPAFLVYNLAWLINRQKEV